jgi:phage regulator Rha-like protein
MNEEELTVEEMAERACKEVVKRHGLKSVLVFKAHFLDTFKEMCETELGRMQKDQRLAEETIEQIKEMKKDLNDLKVNVLGYPLQTAR